MNKKRKANEVFTRENDDFTCVKKRRTELTPVQILLNGYEDVWLQILQYCDDNTSWCSGGEYDWYQLLFVCKHLYNVVVNSDHYKFLAFTYQISSVPLPSMQFIRSDYFKNISKFKVHKLMKYNPSEIPQYLELLKHVQWKVPKHSNAFPDPLKELIHDLKRICTIASNYNINPRFAAELLALLEKRKDHWHALVPSNISNNNSNTQLCMFCFPRMRYNPVYFNDRTFILLAVRCNVQSIPHEYYDDEEIVLERFKTSPGYASAEFQRISPRLRNNEDFLKKLTWVYPMCLIQSKRESDPEFVRIAIRSPHALRAMIVTLPAFPEEILRNQVLMKRVYQKNHL